MRYLLLVLLSLAVVAGIRAVGVVLVSALLVTPAATASLVTRRVGSAVAVAAGLSVLSTVGGLLLSYHVPRTPTGAAVVLVATGLFLLVAATRPWIPRLPPV
jgi:ABC-type Mn2+/Zn2+ transport system permease subunit